jgi:hypothetical protein
MNSLVFGLGVLSAVTEARVGGLRSLKGKDGKGKGKGKDRGEVNYIATFDEDTTMIEGEFEISISSGSTEYDFDIDLNGFTSPDSCDLSAGLSYHIHSLWTHADVTSAVGGMCGGDYTSGHYDPFFACGGATSSTTECAALARTTPYSCSTTTYGEGNYQFCEVGDLSGKFGKVMPASSTDLTFYFGASDMLGPLAANYDVASDDVSKGWGSIVFHCAAGGSRQFCAKFVEV